MIEDRIPDPAGQGPRAGLCITSIAEETSREAIGCGWRMRYTKSAGTSTITVRSGLSAGDFRHVVDQQRRAIPPLPCYISADQVGSAKRAVSLRARCLRANAGMGINSFLRVGPMPAFLLFSAFVVFGQGGRHGNHG